MESIRSKITIKNKWYAVSRTTISNIKIEIGRLVLEYDYNSKFSVLGFEVTLLKILK
jgi:hypothetical protein